MTASLLHNFRTSTLLASKKASRQASKQLSKQASKQASRLCIILLFRRPFFLPFLSFISSFLQSFIFLVLSCHIKVWEHTSWNYFSSSGIPVDDAVSSIISEDRLDICHAAAESQKRLMATRQPLEWVKATKLVQLSKIGITTSKSESKQLRTSKIL